MKTKYEWGVEYATNGKRPDLPNDVEVVCFGYDGVNCGNGRVFERRWDLMEKFKITDPRYKPADTSYLDVKQQDHFVEANEKVDNSWHERGELPPVGAECEVIFPDDTEPKWEHVVILFRSDFWVVASFSGVEHSFETVTLKAKAKFRPIRTEREKVIEAAVQVCTGVKIAKVSDGLTMNTLNKLFDAGMLVLTPKKSDTKD